MPGYLGYVPGVLLLLPAPDLAPPSEAAIRDLYRDLDLDPRLLLGASPGSAAASPVHIVADLQVCMSGILLKVGRQRQPHRDLKQV